jgi:hypothetical protein
MAVTVPTVQSSGDTHWNRMQDQSRRLAVIGWRRRRARQQLLLDGYPITDLQNRSTTNPSQEMVDDVRVQVHTYDSEMGRTGGGVFNTAAKSGSNQFRGAAYYLTRPSSMVGGNFFNEIRDLETNDQYWRNRRRRASADRSSRTKRSSSPPARRTATAPRRTTRCTCRPPRCATATSATSATRRAARS